MLRKKLASISGDGLVVRTAKNVGCGYTESASIGRRMLTRKNITVTIVVKVTNELVSAVRANN